MRVCSLRLQRVLLYSSAEIQSALLLHFREELVDSRFLVGLLDHVDESEQFLDADEDPVIRKVLMNFLQKFFALRLEIK